MKNKEKYIDELAKSFSGKLDTCSFRKKFILTTGICGRSTCTECNNITEKWLEEECIEPEIDWFSVLPFTKVLVADIEDEEWFTSYFISYLPDNKFKFLVAEEIVNENEQGIEHIESSSWKYCKLANKDDIEKYRKKEITVDNKENEAINSNLGTIIDSPLEEFKKQIEEQKVPIGVLNNLKINLFGAYNELTTRKDYIIKQIAEEKLSISEPSTRTVIEGIYAELTKIEQKSLYLTERINKLSDVG